MAKNNKYTSINFNHIHDKNTTSSPNTNFPTKSPSPSQSPSHSTASYSSISAPNKSHHARMLVLTRPTPKPKPPQPKPTQQQQVPHRQTQPKPSQQQEVPHRQTQPPSDSISDPISLRPLGRTGYTSSLSSSTTTTDAAAPNCDKDKDFLVIASKTDKFVPPHLRPGFVPREGHKPDLGRVGLSGRYADNGRPKSGGYERIMNRPGSSGNRPSSSG